MKLVLKKEYKRNTREVSQYLARRNRFKQYPNLVFFTFFSRQIYWKISFPISLLLSTVGFFMCYIFTWWMYVSITKTKSTYTFLHCYNPDTLKKESTCFHAWTFKLINILPVQYLQVIIKTQVQSTTSSFMSGCQVSLCTKAFFLTIVHPI